MSSSSSVAPCVGTRSTNLLQANVLFISTIAERQKCATKYCAILGAPSLPFASFEDAQAYYRSLTDPDPVTYVIEDGATYGAQGAIYTLTVAESLVAPNAMPTLLGTWRWDSTAVPAGTYTPTVSNISFSTVTSSLVITHSNPLVLLQMRLHGLKFISSSAGPSQRKTGDGTPHPTAVVSVMVSRGSTGAVSVSDASVEIKLENAFLYVGGADLEAPLAGQTTQLDVIVGGLTAKHREGLFHISSPYGLERIQVNIANLTSLATEAGDDPVVKVSAGNAGVAKGLAGTPAPGIFFTMRDSSVFAGGKQFLETRLKNSASASMTITNTRATSQYVGDALFLSNTGTGALTINFSGLVSPNFQGTGVHVKQSGTGSSLLKITDSTLAHGHEGPTEADLVLLTALDGTLITAIAGTSLAAVSSGGGAALRTKGTGAAKVVTTVSNSDLSNSVPTGWVVRDNYRDASASSLSLNTNRMTHLGGGGVVWRIFQSTAPSSVAVTGNTYTQVPPVGAASPVAVIDQQQVCGDVTMVSRGDTVIGGTLGHAVRSVVSGGGSLKSTRYDFFLKNATGRGEWIEAVGPSTVVTRTDSGKIIDCLANAKLYTAAAGASCQYVDATAQVTVQVGNAVQMEADNESAVISTVSDLAVMGRSGGTGGEPLLALTNIDFRADVLSLEATDMPVMVLRGGSSAMTVARTTQTRTGAIDVPADDITMTDGHRGFISTLNALQKTNGLVGLGSHMINVRNNSTLQAVTTRLETDSVDTAMVSTGSADPNDVASSSTFTQFRANFTGPGGAPPAFLIHPRATVATSVLDITNPSPETPQVIAKEAAEGAPGGTLITSQNNKVNGMQVVSKVLKYLITPATYPTTH